MHRRQGLIIIITTITITGGLLTLAAAMPLSLTDGPVAMAGAVAAAAAGPDDRDEIVRKARAAEARRVALVERIAPAVVAMFRPTGQGGGSGVIIDPDGYVLTNFHVTGDSPEMRAGLPNGRVIAGAVIGLDPYADLALIKLEEPGPYPWAPIAPPDSAAVGDWTLAMGNPFLLATDFHPTVTMGIVSGTNRFLPGSGRQLIYADCVQVDTPINPGNSGGPLFDMQGRILGINGRISGRDRGRVNVGVGFAVSANQIHEVLSDLRAGKLVEHGYLEATVREEEDETAERGFRVIIDNMYEDSAAALAGLKLGDEIVEFEGEAVRGQNHFLNTIGVLPMGRRVSLVYRREGDDGTWGEPTTAHATLARYPSASKELRRKHTPDTDHVAWETERVLRRYRDAVGARPWQGIGWEGKRDRGRGFKEMGVIRKGLFMRETFEEGEEPAVVRERDPEDFDKGLRDRGFEVILIDGLADPETKRLTKTRYVGGDKIDGRLVEVVETEAGEDVTFRCYFDPETHWLVGYEFESAQAGTILRVRLSDHRAFEDRVLPYRIEHGTDTEVFMTTVIERYIPEAELPELYRTKPAPSPEKPAGKEF